jgi:hypothetical protein
MDEGPGLLRNGGPHFVVDIQFGAAWFYGGARSVIDDRYKSKGFADFGDLIRFLWFARFEYDLGGVLWDEVGPEFADGNFEEGGRAGTFDCDGGYAVPMLRERVQQEVGCVVGRFIYDPVYGIGLGTQEACLADLRALGRQHLLALPRGLEESRPVSVKDIFDVRRTVATGLQNRFQLAEIGNGVEVVRRLFRAETSIEIAAYGDVTRVARELADVVHVVDDVFESDVGSGRPVRDEHPVVESRADDAVSFDDEADLVVGELAAAGS